MIGGDDFFSEIERAFFGGGRNPRGFSPEARSSVSKDSEHYVSNFAADYDRVEDASGYYVVVNFLDVVRDSDIAVSVDDDFDDGEDERSGWLGGGDKGLVIAHKGKKQSFLKLKIPKKIAKRSMKHKITNGILEVVFEK